MLPLSPPKGGGLKNARRPFLCKIALHLKKVCYKVLCVSTVSDNVVRHALAYLSKQKWLVGDVPLKVNFLVKVNYLLADFLHVFKVKGQRYNGGKNLLNYQ